jgi:hypothetical protein
MHESLSLCKPGRPQMHSVTADVCLAVGMSMRVAPACGLPALSYGRRHGKLGKLAIANMQATPFDEHCAARAFSKPDAFHGRGGTGAGHRGPAPSAPPHRRRSAVAGCRLPLRQRRWRRGSAGFDLRLQLKLRLRLTSNAATTYIRQLLQE